MLRGTSAKKIYAYQLLTLGFYFFYWCSHSRQDINRAAGQKLIPTTWLLAVPAANYWWMWRYAKALEVVSFARLKTTDTFALYIIGSSFTPGMTWILRLVLDDTSTTADVHAAMVVVIIFVALMLLAGIIGLGFFCATMQNKINAITASSPPKPLQ